MKTPHRILTCLVAAAALAGLPRLATAVDGSWTQAGGGNQDWANTANWLDGVIPSGTDAAAIANVNVTADQNMTNLTGVTIGHIYFQDPTTSTAGGFGFGTTADLGPVTFDVTTGRSVIGIGTLNTGSGKKVATGVSMVNNDGILKIGPGQLSIRTASPGLTADYIAAGGLTDIRVPLTGLTNVGITANSTFQVDFGNAAINATNLLNPAATVVLGGTYLSPLPVIPPLLPLSQTNPITGSGTLTISGRTTSSNLQTVAGVTFNKGSHQIALSSGTTNSITVFDPTSYTRNPGAVVNFASSGASMPVLLAGGLVNNAQGIIGGWATSGTNWATVSSSNTVAPLLTYQTSLDPSIWQATDNVSLAGNATAPIGTRTINTLRTAASSTNTIGAGNTLSLAGGGLLFTTTNNILNEGTLTGPVGGGELIIHQTTGGSANSSSIGSVIADNGGPIKLVKSGGGYIYLTGTNANTYSGGTLINQGALQIGDYTTNGGNGLSLGSGPVEAIGTLIVTISNDVAVANSISGPGLLVKQGPGTLTLSGVNSYTGYNPGAPGYAVTGVGGYLGTVGTRLDAGTIAIANDNALGGTFRFNNPGATLRSSSASTRTIPNGFDIAAQPTIFGSPASGDLVLTGPVDTGNASKTLTISNALTRIEGPIRNGTGPGANTTTKNGPGTLVLANPANPITKPWVVTEGVLQISDEANLGANPAGSIANQLTLNGGTLRTTTTMAIDDSNRGIQMGGLGGTIDVAAGTTLTLAPANGVGSLTKTGTGNLLMFGGHAYTGATLVNQGTVSVDPSTTFASSMLQVGAGATLNLTGLGSPLTLAANQTIAGSGTVVGNLNGSSTGSISPGTATPGTLTINGNVSLIAGDTLTFDLTNNVTVGGGVNDLLVVNGNLTLDNNLVNIRGIAPGGTLASGKYRLVNYTGTKTGTLTVTPSARFSLSIDDSVPNQINLNVSGNAASIVWKGNNGNAWDINSTPNWLNGVTSDVYFDFDTVTFNDTAVNYNVSLDVPLQPNAVTVAANNNYTFTGSGGLNGPMSLTKSGTGKLILGNNGANTYAGGTVINGGTLQVGQNDGSGSLSGSISNNGVLIFQNTGPVTITNLTGTGALRAEGTYDLVLSGANTYSGPTTIGTNGQISLDAAALSSLQSLGATPSISVLTDGAFYTTVGGVYTQAVVLNGSGKFGAQNGALQFSGVTATLTGPLTLGSSSFISVDGGGTVTLSNSITGGAAGLTKVGANALVLAANNTYGATTNLTVGSVIQIGNGGTAGSFGSGPVENVGGILFNRSDDYTIANNFSGTGGIDKQGVGTLTLTGANTLDGTTSPYQPNTGLGFNSFRISAGTVAVGADNALGTGWGRFEANVTLRAADATTRSFSNPFDIANNFILGSATSGNLVFNGQWAIGGAAKTVTVSNALVTINGVINGQTNGNAFTKAGPGTMVITSTNAHGRPVVVSGGTLLINGESGTNTVTANNTATLGGSGVIQGPVTIQAGGILAPGAVIGSIGTLSISNTVTLSGTNIMEVNKTANTRDLVQGVTTLNYGGTLAVSYLAGSAAAGDSYKLFDAAAYNGSFAAIVPASPGAGLAWDTSNLAVNGTLGVIAGGIPTTPTNLTFSVSGSTLTLTWPSDYLGWTAQSNSLDVANPSLWYDIPGSAASTSLNITVEPGTPKVFYRLRYQTP